jgi:hypothetical protein
MLSSYMLPELFTWRSWPNILRFTFPAATGYPGPRFGATGRDYGILNSSEPSGD